MQILLNHLLRPHLILGFKSDSLLIGFTQKCICENTTINLQKCIETRHVVRKKSCFLYLHGFQGNSRLFHTFEQHASARFSNSIFRFLLWLNSYTDGKLSYRLFEDQWICYWLEVHQLVLVFKADFHWSLKGGREAYANIGYRFMGLFWIWSYVWVPRCPFDRFLVFKYIWLLRTPFLFQL